MTAKTVLIVIAGAIAATIGSCNWTSHSWTAALDAIQVGDAEASVIARFGTQPSVREKSGKLFARYASSPCRGECVERLWFENRLSLGIEAWSVELDKNRRVIDKAHWVSP